MKAARRTLGLAVLVALPAACAVYKDDILPSELDVGAAGAAAAGRSSSGSSGTGVNGGTSAGNDGVAGASTHGGSSGSGGSQPIEGQGGEVGAGGDDAAGGEAAGGDASGGTSAGMGGKAGAGGAGGKGGGGAGGKAGQGGGGQGGGGHTGGGQGGGGGTGGKPAEPSCDDHPLTALASWVPTASHQGTTKDFVINLIDNKTTRWSTSKTQAGDEWLQIDFGATVSITHVNLQQAQENANDYPRKYSLIVSNTPNDLNGTVRVSGVGVAGVSTSISLPDISTGRYLLIKQTGTSLSWWSAEEIEVSCVDP
jgi:hypothetical protein